MIIAKEGAKDPIIKVCGGTRDLTSWEWCKKRIEMDPGIYYAAIKVEWKSASVKKLGFGVYGSVPADKGGKASVELTSGSSTGAFEGVAKTLIDKKGMGMEKV